MMFNKYPLVYVEWEDHSSDGGHWQSGDEVNDTVFVCASVGWLYKETDKKIVLIASAVLQDGGDVGDVRHIVKSCITKQVTLRKVRAPRKSRKPKQMMVAEELPGEVEAIAIGNGSER